MTRQHYSVVKVHNLRSRHRGKVGSERGKKMTEETMFEKGAVKITSARAILGKKTFAMSGITSVEMGRDDTNKTFPAALMLIGAIISLLSILGGLSGGGISLPILVVGIFLATAGVFVARQQRPNYIVKIGSASGETDGYQSENKSEIEEIVDAINDAIVRRG